MIAAERKLEEALVSKLRDLKYEYRPDIRDRSTLEQNFREKFEALNRVRLTDTEFTRLIDEIVTPDVFSAARTLRERNSFIRDDGTPLNYTLVNIRDWCKNAFEVVNQLRINTDTTSISPAISAHPSSKSRSICRPRIESWSSLRSKFKTQRRSTTCF
ncbi:hypothetical protein KUL72_02140 [Bradyrhizobium arachidis]|nr:hypothetical protein KUL72_02140 [Bradyrhizobium arachidis]